MFTYPIMGAGGLPFSDFDAAVEALSPDLWIKFQDASFATQLEDFSGNSAHLGKLYSPAATAVAPLRTTQAQSARFAGNTAGNTFTDNSPIYAHSDTTWITAHLASKTRVCYQLAFKAASEVMDSGEWQIVGSSVLGATTSPFLAMEANGTASGAPKIREHHTTGFVSETVGLAAGDVFDADTHIATVIYDQTNNYRRFYLDGVQEFSDVYGATLHSLVYAWRLNGHSSATGEALQMDWDHHAVWGTNVPSHAQILDMHTKYLAEKA